MAKGCRPCCSLPHGWMSLAVALCATLSTILSLSALISCRFVTIEDAVIDYLPNISSVYRSFGLVSYEKYNDSCQPYYEDWYAYRFPKDLGAFHIAAKAFGITALVVGAISMIISWSVCCIACDRRFIKSLGAVYALCVLFQGLVMLFFGGDLCKAHDCIFGSAAGVAIAAIIFWTITSVLCFKIGPFDDSGTRGTSAPVLPVTSSSPDQNVKVTETRNPDGSKVVVKETINADGSKLVETTKIEMSPV